MHPCCLAKRSFAEPGPYQVPAFVKAPALQRTAPQVLRAALRPGHGKTRIPPHLVLYQPRRHVFGVATMPRRPRDLADRMSERRKPDDGFLRETFTLPRLAARARARAVLDSYPAAGYMSKVESWRELPDGQIEFTMRRLKSAD